MNFNPPVMPYREGPSKLQFRLAADVINSAAKTFIDVKGLNFIVKSNMVPKSAPL
jgi:hypothetical protein